MGQGVRAQQGCGGQVVDRHRAEGVKMLKHLAEREVIGSADDEVGLTELALRSLYTRKAFRETTGVDEERLGAPEPPPPRHHPKPHHPKPRHPG